MSIPQLLQVQTGKETTWGTPVAATCKLLGIEKFELEPVVEMKLFDKELRGSLAPAYIGAVAKVEAKGKGEGVVLFEDILYWIEGLFGTVTPGGAGPYTRAYVAPLGTAPTPRLQTIIYGNGADPEPMRGVSVVPVGLKVEGASGMETKFSVDLIGQKVDNGGSLAALSDRAVNPVMGDAWALYIDAVGGTIGTTVIAATAFTFSLEFKSNYGLKRYLGSLTPGAVRPGDWDLNLKLGLEFNATSKTYIDEILAYASLPQRQIQLKATQGTNILQFGMGCAAKAAPKMFSEKDGVVTVDLEYLGIYNTALGNFLKVDSTSGLATLP